MAVNVDLDAEANDPIQATPATSDLLDRSNEIRQFKEENGKI